MRYFTAARETGDLCEEFKTYEECKKAIAEYEEHDKKEGIYVPDFYDIVDEDHRSYTTNEDYEDVNSGVAYTMDELFIAYKQSEQDLMPQYDSFDAYFEAMMSLGGQGVGGWRKVG